MSDDWQDAAFTSRHMHKRSSRGSRSSKSSTAFDVRKTFGEYELKCPAWQKLDHVSTDSATPVLELYRLTEDGLGVVGELRLPDAMHAAVVLAGSREGLRRVMEGLEGAGGPSGGRAHDEDEEDEDEDENEDDDDGPDRFETFEKNSFRNPKFWVRWRAIPPPPKPKKWKKLRRYTKKNDGDDEMGEEDLDAEDDKEDSAAAAMVKGGGLGYIVFTGNLCRKFKGTLSCAELGWKDVAVTGFKEVGRSESDTRVMWGDVEM